MTEPRTSSAKDIKAAVQAYQRARKEYLDALSELRDVQDKKTKAECEMNRLMLDVAWLKVGVDQ